METPSYRDIAGQATSLARTVEVASAVDLGRLDAATTWVFTGCGASFHAATAAAGLLTALGHVPALAAPASDVWMNPDVWVRPGHVVVGLSRTGTTTETIAALETAKACGAATIGISLSADTPIVTQPDIAVLLDHVGEQGRVMTRSFANLLLAAQVLGVRAATAGGGTDGDQLAIYRSGLAEVGAAVEAGRSGFDDVARVVAKAASGHVVFLGSGPDIGLCRQGALQTQETARPAVEAHTVLDYRHGPLAAMTPESLLVLMTTARSLPADLVLAGDVATLGGTLVAVGPAEVVAQFPEHVERVPTPGELPLWLTGNVSLPFLQLLAYHLTVARDADPESVRNLDRTKTPHVNPHVLPDELFARGRA